MCSLEMIVACCATIYNCHAKKKIKETTCFYEQSLRLKDAIWKKQVIWFSLRFQIPDNHVSWVSGSVNFQQQESTQEVALGPLLIFRQLSAKVNKA